MANLRQVTIIGGTYAKAPTGNFNAKTSKGETFFVPAAIMQGLGVDPSKKELPTFPIYGYIETTQIGEYAVDPVTGLKTTNLVMVTNDDGSVSPKRIDREQISALYKTRAEFINTINSDFALEMEIKQDKIKIAKEAKMTDAYIESLANADF